MPSCELKDCDEQSTSPDDVTIAKSCVHSMEQGASEKEGEHENLGGHGDQVENEDEEEDEEEEEDVDFNPFLKETPSREASSSLSSEIEGLDADVADSGGYAPVVLATESFAKPSNPVQDYPVGDTDHGEEIVTQTANSSVEECGKGSDCGPPHENRDGSGKLMNADNDLVAGEFNTLPHSKKPVMSMDDDDAICKRTRARCSLAGFTLDELETFLQETDDEDDLQNVDDEAEYRKFLAAVLQGGDGDTHGLQENENADDEDEESDADFELELEEALESDNDEDARYEIQEETYEAAGHRPKTRQNRRQKTSVGGNKKLLGHRPLRPLLPCVPIMQRPAFLTLDGTNYMCNPGADFLPSVSDGSITGFTPHQIGQLHCLIHEHLQLLIQVFSVCVLESSRRHIAARVQELISEMLHVRENVLAWRRLPYPSFCFFPPYIHPSVPNEASSIVDVWRNCNSGNNSLSPDIIAAGKGRVGSQRNGQALEHSSWLPYISGPVLSVMDVAPIRLVGNFVDDVSVVVQEYHRRQLGQISDTLPEKEPLFPLNNLAGATEPCTQALRDTACPTSTSAHFSSDNDQAPKRTMASTLVEKAKKQSVALVPKEIAQLAWRFYPLFNPSLYPHKPPPSSVANRVLFTDAEDELLALGLMEYNTDWKAIQQRFLPCKSKHQIFVRQKNRSSSKAPENPIKAVRRMKTSPLTTEEIARIEEGLKVYKLDWMSIWKFIVPYRDPSLLPRQWRIAIGTQKSYKLDATKKAKRQLYDLRRRIRKSATLASWHSSPEKEDNGVDKAGEGNSNGGNLMEREDEAYVHEAFLADWRPGTSKVSSTFPGSGLQEKSPPIQTPSREGSQLREQLNSSGSGDNQPPISKEFLVAVRTPNSQLRWRPYRARRINNARVVKLAPDLPPVNLPPSVRVMSQSAFKSYQTRATRQTCTADTSVVGHEAGNGVLEGTASSRVNYPVKAAQITRIPVNSTSCNQQPQDPTIMRKELVAEGKGESDLQMHPLLFQAPEDGHFPYYPLHSHASSSSSFNFFTRSPPQLNLSLFHNPHHARSAVNFLGKHSKPKEGTCYQTDFHPLLQRSEDINSSLVAAYSTIQLSSNPEISEGRYAQDQNPLHATDKMSNVNISSTAAALRPVSPCEKSNELDLDIHLSFTPRRPKDVGSRELNECSGAISVTGAVDSSSRRSHKTKNSLIQSGQYLAEVPDRNGSEFNSSGTMVVVPSDEDIMKSADNVEDQSLPEIVMEQEELSDSEDEIGENVEFECEEMADSEGEKESESEQMVGMQNEEVEEADMDADFTDQLHEAASFDDSDSNALGTKESCTMDTKVDNSSSSFRLNLNSRPPGSPFVEPDNEGFKRTSSSLDAKVHSFSDKASKNISYIDDHTKLQKQAVNQPPQPNLKSGVGSSKKSRKRASRTHPDLSRGASKKRNIRLSSDMNSVKSKHTG